MRSPRSSLWAPKTTVREIVVFSFSLAFAIRVYWAIHVQHPIDAVYSDMAGYVLRAQMLLDGQVGGEPRMLALWPWGTHTIVAGEMYLFGAKSIVGIGLCQGFVGALAAPCSALLTIRFVPGRLAALISGLTVATWEPHIAYTGFFSSELWFASAMLVGTLFAVRYAERRRLIDALVCGVLLGLTFVTRPQVLLTVILVLGFIVLARISSRRLFPRVVSWRRGMAVLAAFLLPLLVMMGVSSLRFYRLMGRPGLIAAYEPIQRVFAETDVVKIEAAWTTASGERWTFWFKSAAKDVYKPITPGTTEVFEGFIADPIILGEIKKRRLANVTTSARIGRMLNNVSLLIANNRPWPESDTQVKYRRILMIGYSNAIWVVLGLAMVGIFALGRRNRAAAMLVRAQLLTIFLVGAIYIGEARYRVPYDPLLIVVATVGVFAILRFVMDRWASARVRDFYFHWQRRLS